VHDGQARLQLRLAVEAALAAAGRPVERALPALAQPVPPALLGPELGPAVAEVHLHDTDGFSDDHLPIGDGALDWQRVFEDVFRNAPDAVKVIEMPLEAGLASLRRIKSAGYSDLQLELL
jgi:hypothetical protein